MMKVHSRPQITKLLPVEELMTQQQPQQNQEQQQTSDKVKPLDKFLGKLRATYNFVFRKPDNTSNVERILAKDAPNPDVEALKFIWTDPMNEEKQENKTNIGKLSESPLYNGKKLMIVMNDQEWQNDIPSLDDVEPLGPLEIENTSKDLDVEIVTPGTSLQLPVTLSRQLVEWLGSLLGLTYGVYSKLARAIHSTDNTPAE